MVNPTEVEFGWHWEIEPGTLSVGEGSVLAAAFSVPNPPFFFEAELDSARFVFLNPTNLVGDAGGSVDSMLELDIHMALSTGMHSLDAIIITLVDDHENIAQVVTFNPLTPCEPPPCATPFNTTVHYTTNLGLVGGLSTGVPYRLRFRARDGDGSQTMIRTEIDNVQFTNAYLIAQGDADGDRDVDITDFTTLATNFDPSGSGGPYEFTEGNFDGDGDIDITDFNLLANNFAPGGYAGGRSLETIPEPPGIGLLAAAMCALGWMLHRRS